jgi:hypothetical protein
MSGDEPFLARWSRRKRNAAAQSDAEKNPPPRAAEWAEPASPTTGEPPSATPLPPIESIGSASDIKAFLAPGVPPELTLAALRRAWTADPAIRDFIGLSENAWDFNAPDGVPGFGSLDLEKVRRLAAKVLGQPEVADPTSATVPVVDAPVTSAEAAVIAPIVEAPQSIAAAQHEDDERKAHESCPRRHHGGALPQ